MRHPIENVMHPGPGGGLVKGHFEFMGDPVPDVKTDTLAAVIAERYPRIWRSAYTKHYDAPGVYRSFKYVAVQFAMGKLAAAYNAAHGENMVSNVPVLYQILEEYNWPTYHVHASMFAAMQRTHAPPDKTWNDIALPYPGVIFMLPKGSLCMPRLSAVEGSELIPIVYIGVARIKRGRFKFKSEFGEPDGRDRICVFWSADTLEGPVSHDCAFPDTQALEPDPRWIDEATAKQGDDGFHSDGIVDSSYTAALAGVIANLLLLRGARPEYIEDGGPTGKRLGSGAAVHRPTFIGRRYAVRTMGARAPSDGHFTELGWRAGHMKEQPCGPRREQRKTVWIEPYMAHIRGLTRENKAETVTPGAE